MHFVNISYLDFTLFTIGIGGFSPALKNAIFPDAIFRELYTFGRSMSQIGYSGIEGVAVKGAVEAAFTFEEEGGGTAVVRRRRNLSSLTVTTQHRSSQYISDDVRRPDSLIFRSPPLPPDPVPCCSLPIRFPRSSLAITHGCVSVRDATTSDYRLTCMCGNSRSKRDLVVTNCSY